jgi:hypothetical protein
VEADAQVARGLDLDLQQVAGAVGEDVVVVGGRAAPRAQQGRQPGTGGGALDLGIEVGPGGIQVLEPLEQRRLLRQSPRGPLVEVVVAVDQPRRGEAAAAVDADLVLAVRGRGGPRADGVDEAVADDEVAVGVLGALGVDRGDGAALDHQPGHRAPSAARRTASRIFS